MGIACFFLICSIVHALGTLIEQRKPHHAYASLGSCRGCSVTSRGATPSSSPQLPLVWVKNNLFSVNCQHLCSIVQPPFRHFSFPSPHPSSRFSFWPRLTEFWPGWDDVLRISTIYPYQSINLNHSKTISICFKHFELSLSRRGLRQPPPSLFPSSASIFSQLPLASWQPARSSPSTEFQLPFASQQIYAHWRLFASHCFFGTSWKLASD